MSQKWILALCMCFGFFLGFIFNCLVDKESVDDCFNVFLGELMGVVLFAALYNGE